LFGVDPCLFDEKKTTTMTTPITTTTETRMLVRLSLVRVDDVGRYVLIGVRQSFVAAASLLRRRRTAVDVVDTAAVVGVFVANLDADAETIVVVVVTIDGAVGVAPLVFVVATIVGRIHVCPLSLGRPRRHVVVVDGVLLKNCF
jgi:hypothetical protein